ncbi:MAG: 30S ribosome-binding factor RbfA [Gammaproteobacteria bacterium]
MAKEYGRNARVSSQLQKELAMILQREIKDPRLGFVTVNEVEVSRDLAVAKVYVSVLNADEQARKKNIELLNQAANFLRNELGRKIKMRSIPELRFYYDYAIDTGRRISELLEDNGSLKTQEPNSGD